MEQTSTDSPPNCTVATGLRVLRSPRLLPVTLWTVIVLYMVLIYSLSSAPIEDQGPSVTGAHQAVKVAVTSAAGDQAWGERLTPTVEHVVIYEGLGGLALASWCSLRVLSIEGRWRRFAGAAWRWSLPLAVGLAFCYGAFDEWHQGWVAGRIASVEDLVWDMVGAVLGAVSALVVRSMVARDGLLRRWVTTAGM